MPSRRTFLKSSFAAGVAFVAPRPARIRGRVVAAGRGVAGAIVSDGLSSVATDTEGVFELVSDRNARFAFVSLPRGYVVPTGSAGTASIYRRLHFDAGDEAAVRFELEPTGSDEERHRFLVFGDTQVSDDEEVRELNARTIPEVRSLAQSQEIAFGITCGDIVDDTLELFSDYERAVSSTGIPFFQVIGNHDFDPPEGSVRRTRRFEEHFGPTDYSFNRGAVHYVVLNDVFWLGDGYVGFLTEERLSWLASDLAHVEPGSTVVVFSHVPFLSTISERTGGNIAPREAQVTNRDRLHAMLEPFDAHLVTAHTHDNHHLFHGGCHEHVVATVCGAWWSGPVCWDGTPQGYHVFEAGGTLSWRFHATGHPPERQLRLYPPGADARRSDQIVANVWNWDPAWKVFWYENGVRKGEMQRARGLDPMAVSLYEGPHRPLKNSDWVEPVLTDHLFYAPAPAEDARVMVEAVDPWGNVDAQSLL